MLNLSLNQFQLNRLYRNKQLYKHPQFINKIKISILMIIVMMRRIIVRSQQQMKGIKLLMMRIFKKHRMNSMKLIMEIKINRLLLIKKQRKNKLLIMNSIIFLMIILRKSKKENNLSQTADPHHLRMNQKQFQHKSMEN